MTSAKIKCFDRYSGVAETVEFVPIKEGRGILRMEQHTRAFPTLLKFLIREDLSPAFRGPKEEWRCVGTHFSRPWQSGDLFLAFC